MSISTRHRQLKHRKTRLSCLKTHRRATRSCSSVACSPGPCKSTKLGMARRISHCLVVPLAALGPSVELKAGFKVEDFNTHRVKSSTFIINLSNQKHLKLTHRINPVVWLLWVRMAWAVAEASNIDWHHRHQACPRPFKIRRLATGVTHWDHRYLAACPADSLATNWQFKWASVKVATVHRHRNDRHSRLRI